MRYVDAGYVVALSVLFVYAVSLFLRRRRWERAYDAAREAEVPPAVAGHGERS